MPSSISDQTQDAQNVCAAAKRGTVLKGKCEATPGFPKGWGVKPKSPVGGVWIISGTKHYHCCCCLSDDLPSLLDRSLTKPARQVSVTSEILDAHRPMA